MLLTTLTLALSTTAFAGSRDVLTDLSPSCMPDQIEVYITNQGLMPGDSLYDGSNLVEVMDGNAKLVWVDLEPGAAFPHDSYYILVWPDGGLDVYDGENKPYVYSFFGNWSVWGQSWTSDFPMTVPGPVGGDLVEVYGSDTTLPAGTVLTDGKTGGLMVVDDNAYYFWIDTMPKAKFAHPTWHVFIEADGDLQTIEGKWFPYLKGDVFLYGDEYVVEYPYLVSQ